MSILRSKYHGDGFDDSLIAGVWVGNDDHTPMKGVVGGSLPATIWTCEEFYHSFRASDCTYQPYWGPQQYCER